MRALYLSHPQVRMDPAIPVPLWGLSDIGKARADAFVARSPGLVGAVVFSSRETKALELAERIAGRSGTPVLTDHDMGENDRSATGFLPPALFEDHADRFFAAPDQSVNGWEKARAAQARIVASVRMALASVPADARVVFCGHGAVGTLLKCHVAGLPISRAEDQSRKGGLGGGNGFLFDFTTPALLIDWTPFEEIGPDWFD
ncbi:histidine phosphatase family protein [Devosia chinhatensis]